MSDELKNASDLEPYRRYLEFLARTHLASRYQSKIGASDIVQQTMLQAFEAREQYRGTTPEEKLAWLRQILVRSVAHVVREMNAQKRDIKREKYIEQDIEKSSLRLAHFLSNDQSSPSQQAMNNERSLQLAQAIEQLPSEQRLAVILKYWQSMSLQQVADSMNKTVPAIAGLLHRATQKLRESCFELG